MPRKGAGKSEPARQNVPSPGAQEFGILSYLLVRWAAGGLPAADLLGCAPWALPGTYHLTRLQGLRESTRLSLGQPVCFVTNHRLHANPRSGILQVEGRWQQRRPDRRELPERLRPRLGNQPHRPREAPLRTFGLPAQQSRLSTISPSPLPTEIPLSLVLTQENLNTVNCIRWPIESPVGGKVSISFGGREEEEGETES